MDSKKRAIVIGALLHDIGKVIFVQETQKITSQLTSMFFGPMSFLNISLMN